ncbi:GPW/gp25 family protein [Paenibacillus sp. FSL H7-0756]|jgi:phage baseplate assembly protein W|uniref:GPW/gp25 family protein n=1 Tax=unclassified Paenibacillus TaxID=185978 RepID=UPI0003E2A4FA|nr:MULTISPECIES: GPW/gp25 family protein [unclassified Paenibacillus]ETT33891.1 phage baseplate assembly protein W [Paenibacillus sp. FSL R7-269]OMF89528.1 baseplate protein [Paenibacillus sp. FSL R7-0337]
MEVVDFLGRGWTYPLAVQRGSVRSSGGEDSIRESIILILSTARGERVMRPDFGCRLNELVFSPNTMSTATLLRSFIEEALQNWEPRIEVDDITVTPRSDRSELEVSIDYSIRASNSKYNLVYPFFLESVGK